jgi:hypothetical protein
MWDTVRERFFALWQAEPLYHPVVVMAFIGLTMILFAMTVIMIILKGK